MQEKSLVLRVNQALHRRHPARHSQYPSADAIAPVIIPQIFCHSFQF